MMTERNLSTARRVIVSLTTVTLVVTLPLLGLSTTVQARPGAKAPGAKGRPMAKARPGAKARCHKDRTCGGGGGGGAGAGGTTPALTVSVSPDPLVETGPSTVDAVIEVESSASLAGDPVSISSSQLVGSCSVLSLESGQAVPGGIPYGNYWSTTDAPITVTLDDDGNATIVANGDDCVPGNSLVEADLAVSPFVTAVATLVAAPPQFTYPGVSADPDPEVETGDSPTSGNSDVSVVFSVEADPVYAEEPVEITDSQLTDSCGQGSQWYDSSTGALSNSAPEETLDEDGNADFVFIGASCAATTSLVVADVLAGSHPTYTTDFIVAAPQPTI
jgi:hypothetical protein